MREAIPDATGRSAEYRFTITTRGLGSDKQAAEDLLEGFLQTHPETGPVISLSSVDNTISVTLALDASSQQEARNLVAAIWATGCKRSGLAIGEVVRTEVERVADSEAAVA